MGARSASRWPRSSGTEPARLRTTQRIRTLVRCAMARLATPDRHPRRSPTRLPALLTLRRPPVSRIQPTHRLTQILQASVTPMRVSLTIPAVTAASCSALMEPIRTRAGSREPVAITEAWVRLDPAKASRCPSVPLTFGSEPPGAMRDLASSLAAAGRTRGPTKQAPRKSRRVSGSAPPQSCGNFAESWASPHQSERLVSPPRSCLVSPRAATCLPLSREGDRR